MATIGSLVVNLVANTTQFSGGLKKGIAETKKFESRLSSVSKTVGKVAGALGVVGVGVAAGNFLRGAISEAMAAERTMKQLEAVIKSTGGAAGYSAKQIDAMAKEMQGLTTFSDEATKSAAALLLTFTNVKGGVFREAIGTVQDMSIALGQDLKSSVIQVGKALNDPIKGVSALSDVGVSFAEKQREMIKSLVASGQAMKAQQIILKELATEFGGSAAAALDTTSGRLQKLKNDWAEFQEALGKNVGLPAAEVAMRAANSYTSYTKAIGDYAVRGFVFGGEKIDSQIDYSKSNSYLRNQPKPVPSIPPQSVTFPNGRTYVDGKFVPTATNVTSPETVRKLVNTALGSLFVGSNNLDMFKNSREFEAKRAEAAEQRAAAAQMKRMARFGELLDFTLSSQFMGRNKLDLFKGTPNDTKPVAVKMHEAPLFAPTSERGSLGHLEAIVRQRGGALDASMMDLSREQVKQLKQIASNTSGVVVATIGG